MSAMFNWRLVDCSTCGGSGRTSHFRRFAGEAVAGEYVDNICTDCGGGGEEDAECECGEASPLNEDGLCADCVLPGIDQLATDHAAFCERIDGAILKLKEAVR